MYKVIIALIAVLAFGTLATTADARSANIHERTLTVSETSDGFTISAKVSGLAGGFVYDIEVTGTIDGDYQCTNNGGNDPDPKAFETDVTGGGTFVADNNGNVNFTVTTSVPTPDPADVCPNGKTWTVKLLSYSGTVNLQICDNPCESNATLDSAGPIAVSFP